MRRLILAILYCALGSAIVAAQGTNGGILFATDFNQWTLPQGNAPAQGTLNWSPASICTVGSGGYNFVAPKVGRPLTVVDVNPAHTETFIPTQVLITGSGCTVTGPMVYSHQQYYVESGTAGLQEAIDYGMTQPQIAVVSLTPQWTRAGGTTGMVAAATGNSSVSLTDQRVGNLCGYTWNGSQYSSSGCIFLNPLTNLGDTIYQGTAGLMRLPGNVSTTAECYQQAGNGTVSAAPFWGACSGGGATWASISNGSQSGSGAGQSNTLPGSLTLGTAVLTPNQTGIYQVDGNTYASCGAAITAALASSYAGVTVDCRSSGRLGSSADALGSFDPGSKALTVLLGAFTDYTIGSVTLRDNLSIIGPGSILTQITQTSTNGATFTLPQANNSPAISTHLSGFTLLPNASATTQIGADLECGSYSNSGLWYSQWSDVWFGNSVDPFPGGGIKMACSASSGVSAIQYSQFFNVVSFRANGSSNPALYLCGSVGNLQFYGGEFDASNWQDTTSAPNIYLGGCGAGTQNVYSLRFYGTADQGGAELIQFNGANNIQLDRMHQEGGTGNVTNGYLFTLGGSQNQVITVDGTIFASNIGTGTGGYIFNTSNSGTALTLNVSHTAWGAPTNLVIGEAGASTQSLNFRDNYGGGVPVSNGIVPLLGAASTVTTDLQSHVDIHDSGSNTITTITSYLAPGEFLTIGAVGPITFGTGGNLLLGGASTLTLANDQYAVFERDDYTGTLSLVSSGITSGSGQAVSFGSITGTSINSTASGCNGTNPYLEYTGGCGSGGGGSGVTSVGLTVPSWLTVSGSPVTSSGTLAVTATSGETQNEFLATPNGSSGAVGLRAIVGADLPTPTASTLGGIESITSASNEWVSYIDTAGVPHQSQPGFSNLSGNLGTGQGPSSLSGLLKDTSGTLAAAVAGTDYVIPSGSITGNAATATTATTATNLGGTTVDSVPYQSASATTSYLSPQTTNNDYAFIEHVTASAAVAPTWVNAPALSAANMTNFPTFNQNTTGTAGGLTGCSPSTAGSLCYWNGSAWTLLAGNASGTNWLQETSAGVPSWTAPSGSGLSGMTQYGLPVAATATTVTSSIQPSAWTSGHTFVPAWQPSGSALAPISLDLATYLGAPPAIGGTTPAAGSFTTLAASSTVSGSGFSTYLASPPAIGGTSAAAGSFTTLSASSTVSGSGFSTYLASPPAIGGTTPAAGTFSSVVVPSDGTHAGMVSLVPNTTAPTLTSGDFSILGPNASSVTAFAWQAPTATNASAGLLHVGANSSGISQLTVSQVSLSADVSGQLPIANGGTNAASASAALVNLFPAASEVGDLLYCSAYSSGCTTWSILSGNTSGTKYLQETSAGAPSWTTPSGSMTWPGTAGYALYSGSSSWSTPHLFDNATVISATEGLSIAPTSTSQVSGIFNNPTSTSVDIGDFQVNATTKAAVANNGALYAGISSSTGCTTFGTAGGECAAEGTSATNVSGYSNLYPDSTAHEWKASTNGSTSYGLMVRAQPGSINQTGQTASISTATLCAASAGACNVAGEYHIHWVFWGSGTACSSVTSGSVALTATWTDAAGTSHSAIPMPMWDQAKAALETSFYFNTALGTEGASGDYNISSNGSVIQYATTYTGCTTGTGTYNLDMVVTRVQ